MIYFLLYNDDNTQYLHIHQLIKSIQKFGTQYNAIVYNKWEIEQEFAEKHSDILQCNRGEGYGLWKPYIIHQLLQKIKDNDFVFYIDSHYCFVEKITGLYEEYMKNNDLMVWKNRPPNEPIWYMRNRCKMDVIMKYDMYDKVFREKAEDCWAGALIVKKTEKGVQYIKEWLDMCCIYEDISDSPSRAPNSSLFIEHRHDQSLLSIILHKNNIPMQLFENRYLQKMKNIYRV